MHIWNEGTTAVLITGLLALPIGYWTFKTNRTTKNNGGSSMLDKIQATIRTEAETTREEFRDLKQDLRDVRNDVREIDARVTRLEKRD